ncbi:MAG: acetolactate decarboxylase [Candidatus Marinimicrobia bacterium]|nr:acetolactate decarboxylase [Candidatus Neomarinimicrobiota bacterium]
MKNILIIAVVLFIGCGNSALDYNINIYGALFKIMHEGHREGVVSLLDVLQKKHTYGLGAMEGLNGEVLILDNKVIINTAINGGTPTTQTEVTGKDKALLLVTSEVKKWQKVSLDEPVSMGTIDAAIKQYADKMGINTNKPFPFMIEGGFGSVEWHIIDSPDPGGSHDEHMASSWKRIDSDFKGKILGFYSENHQTVFTHHSSFTHMHIVFEDEQLSGHIDDILINKTWQLSVPL